MSDYIYDEFIKNGSILSRDFFNLYVGKFIGGGQYRRVYENDVNKTTIIKFEVGESSFENCIEWEVWKSIKDYPSIARWFAPCLHISPCGTVLVQARCSIAPDSKYPKKVPMCFSDFKRENWGLYKSRMVCFDYGAHSTIILTEGIANCSKLKRVKWWENKKS